MQSNYRGWQLAAVCWTLLAVATARGADWAEQAGADAKLDRTTVIYRGEPPNTLVCDTTLRQVTDGSWVTLMLAGGMREPAPENFTGLTRSSDQGKTWSPLSTIDTGLPRTGDTIAQGPTELIVHNGRCTLFFSTHGPGPEGARTGWRYTWRSWAMHSDDSCRTWSKPEPLPGRLKEYTFIRKFIVTSDGRLMVSFQHYLHPRPGDNGPKDKAGEGRLCDPRNGVLISTDNGATWSEHGNVRLSDDEAYFGWAESSIAELADGRIAMILRGDKLGGVLYYAESLDGGRTWPEFARKTDIPNPGSKATIYSLGGDAVALLHNPDPKHRSPLALWVSFDGLKTWPYRRVLVPESADGPKGHLNYPDGFVSADRQYLHFAYDDNRDMAVYYGAKLPPLARSASEGE